MAKNIKIWLTAQLETILPKKVYAQTDDGNNEQIPYKYPIITFYRLFERQHRAGQRTESYQITPWSDSVKKLEEIKMDIVEKFNNITIDGYRCKCEVGPDIYDPVGKARGIPITLNIWTVDHQN